ncbi:MAG TPA: family 20 glycosylhydrolase [Bacteroidales bacterium]|nr:family 20 glycosylhydrolase [Bacteroidales bacterium]
MKKYLILLLIPAFLKVNGQGTSVSIIPQPVQVRQTSGTFVLGNKTEVTYNDAKAQAIAGMLVQKLNIPTGFSLKATPGESGAIRFILNRKEDPRLGTEGYTLSVTEKDAVISANQPAGLFYGMQSLLQLLPNEIESKVKSSASWTIPGVEILDYPRFKWRGLMLDVSRHFFTKDEVKTYIDEMARFKLNTLHWHLTDDEGWRIEIKSLPRLTQVGAWRVKRYGRFGEVDAPKPGEKATDGGFYTQDDVREILRYAADRQVTIMPEIDVPGHSMAAIASYPELSCSKDTSVKVNPGSNFSKWFDNGKFEMLVDNTLNPSDEHVYEFLDKVFTELAGLFPNPYIHVGGDECYKGFWEKDKGCQDLMKKMNFSNSEQLQAYFENRLEKILKAKGKKLIGWDEILEGGLSPEATVMSWRGIAGGIKAAQLKHDVVMTPTTYGYLDYTQGDPTVDPPIYASLRARKCYSFEPVPDGVEAKYILGGQGNLWTEQVPTLRYVMYMTYPRSWALAEDFWSQKESKSWPGFATRMENQFRRNDLAEVNYSRAVYDAIVEVSRQQDGKYRVAMDSEIPGLDIFYSIDGTMPDNFSLKYAEPFTLPDGPVTMRIVTYRNSKPIGHLITLTPELIKRRARQ